MRHRPGARGDAHQEVGEPPHSRSLRTHPPKTSLPQALLQSDGDSASGRRRCFMLTPGPPRGRWCPSRRLRLLRGPLSMKRVTRGADGGADRRYAVT